MVQRNSIVQARGAVSFPQFNGERHYMIPFTKREGLPKHLRHWQPTVDAMLDGVVSNDNIYLMVDQKFVRAGEAHRRPGIHVDGYWDPTTQLHRGGHRSVVASSHIPQPSPGHKVIDAAGNVVDWADATFEAPEAIILATNVTSAIAYRGKWSGKVGDMGDCDHIDVNHMNPVIMQANTVFAGNAAMLHESIPVHFDCYRTVVRLNVPGWSPEL